MDRLVLATDVDRIYLNYASATAHGLDQVSAADLRRYAAAGHFPAGTMGPKVEAALQFVDAGGAEAIVTSYDRLAAALRGCAGTRVVAGARDGVSAAPPCDDSRAV
jgi:carbamate kinase